MNLQPGSLLRHYQIRSVLGRGGMGMVYRAWDTRLGRDVAIKVLYENLSAQEEYVRRFFREGQAVARLDHPNVLKIYDVGQEGAVCFIVMEYVDGRTLRAILDERGGLPVDEALDCAAQIAGGLECTHTHRVLHRDVKPGNIMVSLTGTVKILDFGLARIHGLSALTMTGNVVGTIDYISPEQVMNEPIDARSDLYSFGVVLYEMVTGQRPFVGEEPIAVIYQHINDDPLPPSAHRPELPPEMDRLILTLMAKRPSDRYASARAFCADLEMCRTMIAGMAGQPEAGLSAAPVVEVRHRPRDEFHCALVGRDVELERMRATIDHTLSGDGRLMLLGGNEGRGKSRLVEEALGYAETQGMWTLSGSCLYQEMVIPYQPFIDALSRRLSTASPVGDARLRLRLVEEFPDIAALMPHLWTAQERKRLEENAPVALTPAAEQQRLFQSIMHLLFELAAERGVVLCMDDLHWGDTGSVQLLHYLARQLAGHRICLIAAYRPEEVRESAGASFGETLRRMQAEGLGETIELDNLDEPAIRTMVQEIMGSRAVPVSVSDQVYKESGGNPLFAIEILKWWRDRSKTQAFDQTTLDHLDEIAEVIPPRITDLIARRLNRLQDMERELLEVAATGGVRFHVDDLASAASVGRMETLRQLHRLERRHGIILPVERGLYQFAHGKIQEVLYQELPEVLRQEYHAAWGRTYLGRKEAGEDVPVEILAAHLYLGGDEEAALPYLMQSGERAQKMCAFREARRYWEQARTLVKEQEGEEAKTKNVEILLSLGRVYYELGEWDLATDHNKQAFGIAQEIKNVGAQARALIQLGSILVGRNQWNAAIQLFEQSIKMYTRIDDQLGIASAHNFLGNIAYWRGQWEKAKEHQLISLQIIEKIDNIIRKAIMQNNLGLTFLSEGNHNMAINYFKISLKNHKICNNILGIAEVDINLGIVHERKENWLEALKYHKESVQLLERMGNARHLWNAYINYARMLARTGDIVLAQEINQKVKIILKDLKNQRGLAEAKRVDGLIASLENNWDKAEALFDESEQLCQESKDPYGHAETLRERGYMFLRKGAQDQAIDYLQRAERAFQDIGAKGDVDLIQRKLKDIETTRSAIDEPSST
jgi:tetratricopeptide (TPR) repeat protein